MEFMMLNLLEKIMDEVNCFSILWDEYYQNVMGNVLNRPLNSIPYFKVILIINLNFVLKIFLKLIINL